MSEAPTFTEAMLLTGFEPYPEQLTVDSYLRSAREDGVTALIEAPTGTGKTANIAWAALEGAREGVTLVAVPSIALVFQTAKAIEAFMTQTPAAFGKIRLQLVLGRGEFVDPELLRASFASPDQADVRAVIEEWIAMDGIGASADHPSWTKHGLAAFLEARGMHPDLPNNATLSANDKSSDAAQAYAAQFDHGANLYIATHAMLANDLQARYFAARRWVSVNKESVANTGQTPAERWAHEHALRLEAEIDQVGRFAQVHHLIIDEAHLLAENFANAFGTGISLTNLAFALHLAVEARMVPASVLKTVLRIRQEMISVLDHQNKPQGLMVNWSGPHDAQTRLCCELSDALDHISRKKLTKLEDSARFQIERAIRGLADSKRHPGHLNTHVTGSPAMRFPTIHIGRRSLFAEMKFFWDNLKSAVLISATIYAPLKAGPSIQHLISALALDKNVRRYPAIPGPWLHQNVTMNLPSQNSCAALTPPRGNADAGQRDTWVTHLASQIISAERNAPSTSLVLSTSLQLTSDLVAALADALPEHTIIDGSRRSLAAGKTAFLLSAGKSPTMWISQGPAWTGLDLPDHLLQRLYVTRMPMPVPAVGFENKTHSDYAENRIRMSMQLKQGFGRLVRSRAALPKDIWLLDGRWSDLAIGIGHLIPQYEKRFF